MATERLSTILNHFKTSPGAGGLAAILSKNPDDIVITLAVRTPLTKAFKGGFKDTPFDVIVMELLKHVLEKSKIDPNLIEDICCGNVNEDAVTFKCRAAALAAGFPNTTAVSSTNRFCSSGLLALQNIANQIIAGSIDIGVAVGIEHMTGSNDKAIPEFDDRVVNTTQEAKDCLQPMGQTSENVANDFNVSRELQDRYAAESYRRAEVAQKAGWFDEEIVPIKTTIVDPKTGESKPVVISKDEGIRYGTTYESLSKIRPAFPHWGGKSTGGNSSQITDGAAAVLLMKRSTAERLGQPIVGKFCGATVVGLAPRIMGIGPSIAIPKLLAKTGLKKEEVDVFEINEAFASMAVYCVDKLGLDVAKVNPRGGAIALGHPLGATGARQVVTGLAELRRTNKKVLLTSMCIGTGQGMAGLFVNEQ
ncbi:hypothetical protein RUND412_005931 [Rhizina undulata]